MKQALSAASELAVKPIAAFGKYSLFVSTSLRRCVFPPVNLRLLMRQLEFVGNRSFGIVLISAAMIGAIFGLILGDIFRTFGAESMLGAAAGIALSQELA